MAKAIIEECIKSTREMLESDWDQIESMRDENEGRIKVAVAYLISYKGNEQAIKTTITFGRKVTESRENIINPDQLDLPMEGNGNEPSESEVEDIASGRKTRRRGAQKA